MSMDKTPDLKEFNYLIVDDSELIRTQISRSLAKVCSDSHYVYQLFNVGRNGQLNTTPLADFPDFEPDGTTQAIYKTYTAATYKLALRVLDKPDLQELTVLCDLSIPSDTEVGLLGFLEGLARRRLAVNLIFMSSDYQNRASIEALLKKGKAFFVEKGTAQWNNLPQALIHRVTSFNYQHLTPDDYSSRTRSVVAPAFIEQLAQATVKAQPGPTAGEVAPPLPINPRLNRTTNPLPNPPAPVEPKPARPDAETTARPNLVGKLVSSVRELPGRADSMRHSGTAKLREIPGLFKKASLPNVSLPGRKKKDGDELPKS